MSAEFLDMFDRIEIVNFRGVSKKNKPRTKSYSIDKIRDRALAMGFKFEAKGNRIFLTPPETNEYQAIDKAQAWAYLDRLESKTAIS